MHHIQLIIMIFSLRNLCAYIYKHLTVKFSVLRVRYVTAMLCKFITAIRWILIFFFCYFSVFFFLFWLVLFAFRFFCNDDDYDEKLCAQTNGIVLNLKIKCKIKTTQIILKYKIRLRIGLFAPVPRKR